jgi:hypothetical protein
MSHLIVFVQHLQYLYMCAASEVVMGYPEPRYTGMGWNCPHEPLSNYS